MTETSAVGWIVFAGALMMILGVFHKWQTRWSRSLRAGGKTRRARRKDSFGDAGPLR